MKKKKPDPRTGHELEPAIPDLQVGGGGDLPVAADLQDLRVGEDLPAVSRETEAALEQVAGSNLGPRMQRILQRVAGGSGVRDACDAEGSSSYSDAYKAARRFKIIDLKTSKLIDGQRSVAGLATELLEERLLENPDKFSGPQLAVVSGIAVDKVLASDKAATDDGGGYISALEAMAERFAESGAGLELKVTVSAQAVAAGHVIDVTPTEAK